MKNLLASPLFAFAVAVALAGCEDISHLADPPQSLLVEVRNPKDIHSASAVLTSRFKEYPPSMFSSVRATAADRTINFAFDRGAPRPETLKFMTSNRGVLVAHDRRGLIWFRERDVVDARVVHTDGVYQLGLTLTDEAGARLDELSRRSVGEVVTLTLDGSELTSARIANPIGKRLLITASRDVSTLLAITVLLRYGPLPEGVRVATP